MPLEENPFRTVFKHYKALPATQAIAESKEPSHPIDGVFACINLNKDACIVPCEKLQSIGLNPNVNSWHAFSVTSNRGLILIRDAITASGQRYWAKLCLVDFLALPHRSNVGDLPCDPLLPQSKLRWATFGYHHDWDTKVYSDSWSPMPSEMIELGLAIGSTLGYPAYRPEASIVNYYMLNSTFCPHVDNSERNLDHPLISISLGQACIFLIGGATKEIEPTALVLRSGDVLVMSGLSRLAYHAVPRIVKDVQFIDHSAAKSSAEDSLILDYLNKHRINLNLRQVD
ncbi:Alkylated DNA repair protein alkB-like protein 1 [Trichuris trichiura]|uniref:Alkylated DNA repair protein alkB-like protein 1 n=1 Tax=Trichuris trichiura TaxID=36087 RepID=A0A077ZDH6_TRITR|nr:Alkylated DNA repair protein alkB-like protein 1 [Trichuris trichiura]